MRVQSILSYVFEHLIAIVFTIFVNFREVKILNSLNQSIKIV